MSIPEEVPYVPYEEQDFFMGKKDISSTLTHLVLQSTIKLCDYDTDYDYDYGSGVDGGYWGDWDSDFDYDVKPIFSTHAYSF